jgi:hypothetical protein
MDSLSSNNTIINDYLSFTSKLTVCLTSVLFFLLVKISLKDELIRNNFEYVILILISVLGLLILCSSNDLMTAYLSIELQSVAFYILASFKKNSCYSVESFLKYFIIGSLSSALFLFGSLFEPFFLAQKFLIDYQNFNCLQFFVGGLCICDCEKVGLVKKLFLRARGIPQEILNHAQELPPEILNHARRHPQDMLTVHVRGHASEPDVIIRYKFILGDPPKTIKEETSPLQFPQKRLVRGVLLASSCIMWVYVFIQLIN